jgi:hypothetical protein
VTRWACHAREWYGRNAPLIVGVMFLLTLVSVIVGVAGVFENNRQDANASAANKTRDEQNARVLAAQQHLLDCFDQYAKASSSSSSRIRVATIAKDVATAERDVTLNAEGVAFLHFVRLIANGQANGIQDIRPLEDALAARAKAGRKLERAQAELDRVRAANPVPPPPSTFCQTSVD